MKRIPLFFLASLLLAIVGITSLVAATYTRQTTRVARFQCDPTYDAAGVCTAVTIQVYYANRVLKNDADSTDVLNPGNFGPVTVDLIAAPVSTTNYTAATKTANGVQAAALLQAIFLAEATRQSVP